MYICFVRLHSGITDVVTWASTRSSATLYTPELGSRKLPSSQRVKYGVYHVGIVGAVIVTPLCGPIVRELQGGHPRLGNWECGGSFWRSGRIKWSMFWWVADLGAGVNLMSCLAVKPSSLRRACASQTELEMFSVCRGSTLVVCLTEFSPNLVKLDNLGRQPALGLLRRHSSFRSTMLASGLSPEKHTVLISCPSGCWNCEELEASELAWNPGQLLCME